MYAYKIKKHIACAAITTLAWGCLPTALYAAGMDMPANKPAAAVTAGYRYELAGPIKSNNGKSIVPIRLMRNGKPVSGAVIIQPRADMGPMGMASMTAPIKALGENPPGTYRFEIDNGPIWNKPDSWALHFSAKVQGVVHTINGSLTVTLVP